MKKIGCLLILLSACLFVLAQSPVDKGLRTINRNTAEAYIGFLASDFLEGREAGTRGGRIAGEYIVSCLKIMSVQPFVEGYYQPFEVYTGKQMNNILGVIPGKISNEYVIVGAHYDHLGINPNLEGDSIYNGADDNASGVSAVLQIAKGFVESGIKPQRTVIFAFWDGEEKKLLGSNFFVETFADLNNIKCYMNFDMIGRNNDESKPNHVVYFYTDTHPQYGEWLKNDIKQYGFSLTPDYRPWDKPVGGSDNASFAKHNIPIIWYHTDGHPDYHKPSDHPEKINWDKLVEITKTAYLLMMKLANE
ncbi:M28 family metallopeptidase [Bacteroides sp. 519]|uniref:M28 family metallopeptidase n=1 Tax=Bacteroides sp. 519 TaxID=2302937 RepID=UPI0013D19FDA|nr:M20/M25/M40 family metallo-hydrolase [Bacteroides sp. 519]NDV59789.1 M20/M25/M40 family metallo-hydrolase [Bacteroides sp. 519]